MALLGRRFARERAAWTGERFAITSGFVEHVVGHRTRVAQQASHLHHLEEDAALERYYRAARGMDRVGDLLASLPARGWLALGLLGLVPAVLGGVGAGPLVVATGGILQAQAAFATLATSLGALLSAAVSWRSIARLSWRPRARARRDPAGRARAPRGVGRRDRGAGRVVPLRRGRGEPVLRGCDLVLSRGDRLLLEGRSGGGKSTLAAVLSGLHAPSSGLVLLRGLDRRTLGRRGVAQPRGDARRSSTTTTFSPGRLAFNLLMGRAWPAPPEDRREAEVVCRKLGLGPLLDRMPWGLDQVVGETGWQLSHGERSRLFLARALLQRSDAVILDELRRAGSADGPRVRWRRAGAGAGSDRHRAPVNVT